MGLSALRRPLVRGGFALLFQHCTVGACCGVRVPRGVSLFGFFSRIYFFLKIKLIIWKTSSIFWVNYQLGFSLT